MRLPKPSNPYKIQKNDFKSDYATLKIVYDKEILTTIPILHRLLGFSYNVKEEIERIIEEAKPEPSIFVRCNICSKTKEICPYVNWKLKHVFEDTYKEYVVFKTTDFGWEPMSLQERIDYQHKWLCMSCKNQYLGPHTIVPHPYWDSKD